jgi:glycopeptide antibiotics resistance protein
LATRHYEAADWSLLLECESFFYLLVSAGATLFFLFLRAALAWYADRRLRVPRFHLRENAVRAGAAFFFASEIKQ